MTTIMIDRDPFARYDTIRQVVKGTRQTCAWCGQQRQTPTQKALGATVGNLFQYGSEHDSGRKHFDSHLFCGLSCRQSFYR